MTREPFIAYSELTNEIYIVVGKEKYRVTEQAIKAIKAIKALGQEPKTGHWDKGYTFPDGEYWKCTKCNELIKVKYPMNYCNNCGSKNKR